MMATTHVLAGMALAAAAASVAPELAPVAVIAAGLGGLFPDLDIYAGHRKTLHYPVYYPLATALVVPLVGLWPTDGTVALLFFLLGAATHSAMDSFGGGLELKPWLGGSNKAVYDHFRGRWIPPRRWIRYDGAPEDLGLAVLLGMAPLAAFGSPIDEVVLSVLAVSAGYTLVRKPIVRVAERLVSLLPGCVLVYVPERFVEGTEA